MTSKETTPPESTKQFDHTDSFEVRYGIGRILLPRGGSLEIWNKCRKEYWDAVRERVQHPERFPNGLSCPKCGGRLYDTQQVISTNPTMLRVKCQTQHCNFRSERYE